ncbi:MAG: response regulator [Oscillospiraceae bacterium]|nr:response regulator [Oscillospiraceae bacterium]
MKESTLGACIRTLRKQNHMTQAQLADRLGVTDKAVSKWERDLSYPDIALFPRLADILGATVDELLRECGGDGQPSRLLQVCEMSQDIRTPLHIILGYAEAAKNHPEDPGLVRRYLEGIRISGEYLMTILNGITQAACGCGKDAACCGTAPEGPEALDRYLQEQISADRKAPDPADFSGRRVLIAEDMAVNREIAAEILKQTGAEIDFAEDGQICLEKVESAPAGTYDLILMDILMPNLDGIEATRRIRQLPDREKAGIPIIALTTNVQNRDRQAAREAGMNAFAEKPVSVEKLFEAMRQIFSGSS